VRPAAAVFEVGGVGSETVKLAQLASKRSHAKAGWQAESDTPGDEE